MRTDSKVLTIFAGVATSPNHVKRLLEVKNGELCYVLGTIYVDMPLKPNVLEDLARDVGVSGPCRFFLFTLKVSLAEHLFRVVASHHCTSLERQVPF